jgi:hypothetical protein
MIWALLAMLLFGGGAGSNGGTLTAVDIKQMSTRAEVIIEDPVRAQNAQETLAKLRKEAKAYEKVFTKSGKQLIKSYKDHASDIDEERAIQKAMNSSWSISQQRALDLRFELKESMTEEEWTELFLTE